MLHSGVVFDLLTVEGRGLLATVLHSGVVLDLLTVEGGVC